MQKLKIIDYRLPDWALPYLINSDPSGIENADIETIGATCYDCPVIVGYK